MDILATTKKRYNLALENQRDKFQKFNEFDFIYHSKLKDFDPNIPSKVFNPIAWSFIETIVTRMLAKNPVIVYQPREDSDRAKAELASELFSYWYSKTNQYPTIVSWVKDALIYGTGILKVDWFTSPTRMVKSYQTDENGEAAVDEQGNFIINEEPVIDFDDPRTMNVNLYDFFIDPSATSIDDAKWVIHQYYASIKDLEAENKAAEQHGKVIYNKSALRRLKAGTPKPNEFEAERKKSAGFNSQPNDETVDRIKIWEMWENGRCVFIADESEIIRDETNYFWHGKKPFIRIVDSIVPHEFFGKGEIEPIEKLVHALNTTQNQRITNVNRVLSPMWKARDSVDDDELQFIDNGIVHVSDKDDANIIAIPDITSKANEEQGQLTDTMQRALGVTDYVQGIQTPGQTAKEVEIKTSQANARFAHKIKLFEEMGLKELGEFVQKLYQQFITKSKIIRITNNPEDILIEVKPEDLVGEFDVMPESESTLETDQQAEFTKFLNLFNLLQPYTKQQSIDPNTGQTVETGLIDLKELIKELIIRSGEKSSDKFFGSTESQNEQTGQVPQPIPGQVPQPAEAVPGILG